METVGVILGQVSNGNTESTETPDIIGQMYAISITKLVHKHAEQGDKHCLAIIEEATGTN